MIVTETSKALQERVRALMPKLEGKEKALAERAIRRLSDVIQAHALAIAAGDPEAQRIAVSRLGVVADTIEDLAAAVDLKFMPTVFDEAGKTVLAGMTAVGSAALDMAIRSATDALVSRLSQRWPS